MNETLRYLRESKKYSQTELAAHLGISRQMYIKYENGDVEPSVSIIKKLCELYKVEYSTIIDNKFKELYYIESKSNPVQYNIPKTLKDMIVSEPSASYQVSSASKSLVSKNYDIAWEAARKLKNDELFKLLSSIVKLMENQREKPKENTMTKEESLKFFEEMSGCIKNPELADVDYKELLYEALDEKYNMKGFNAEIKDKKND